MLIKKMHRRGFLDGAEDLMEAVISGPLLTRWYVRLWSIDHVSFTAPSGELRARRENNIRHAKLWDEQHDLK